MTMDGRGGGGGFGQRSGRHGNMSMDGGRGGGGGEYGEGPRGGGRRGGGGGHHTLDPGMPSSRRAERSYRPPRLDLERGAAARGSGEPRNASSRITPREGGSSRPDGGSSQHARRQSGNRSTTEAKGAAVDGNCPPRAEHQRGNSSADVQPRPGSSSAPCQGERSSREDRAARGEIDNNSRTTNGVDTPAAVHPSAATRSADRGGGGQKEDPPRSARGDTTTTTATPRDTGIARDTAGSSTTATRDTTTARDHTGGTSVRDATTTPRGDRDRHTGTQDGGGTLRDRSNRNTVEKNTSGGTNGTLGGGTRNSTKRDSARRDSGKRDSQREKRDSARGQCGAQSEIGVRLLNLSNLQAEHVNRYPELTKCAIVLPEKDWIAATRAKVSPRQVAEDEPVVTVPNAVENSLVHSASASRRALAKELLDERPPPASCFFCLFFGGGARPAVTPKKTGTKKTPVGGENYGPALGGVSPVGCSRPPARPVALKMKELPPQLTLAPQHLEALCTCGGMLKYSKFVLAVPLTYLGQPGANGQVVSLGPRGAGEVKGGLLQSGGFFLSDPGPLPGELSSQPGITPKARGPGERLPPRGSLVLSKTLTPMDKHDPKFVYNEFQSMEIFQIILNLGTTHHQTVFEQVLDPLHGNPELLCEVLMQMMKQLNSHPQEHRDVLTSIKRLRRRARAEAEKKKKQDDREKARDKNNGGAADKKASTGSSGTTPLKTSGAKNTLPAPAEKSSSAGAAGAPRPPPAGGAPSTPEDQLRKLFDTDPLARHYQNYSVAELERALEEHSRSLENGSLQLSLLWQLFRDIVELYAPPRVGFWRTKFLMFFPQN